MNEEKDRTTEITAGLPPTLTAKQLADFLGVTPGHIYNARSNGLSDLPPAHKLGRRIVYFTADVVNWLSQR